MLVSWVGAELRQRTTMDDPEKSLGVYLTSAMAHLQKWREVMMRV
jgi:hypothetical protein